MVVHVRAIAVLALLAFALPTAADLVQTPNGYPRLPSTTRATAVDAGEAHTCIVVEGGNVDCWGARSLEQAWGVPGSGDFDYGQAADYGGGDAKAVSAGYSHTCILRMSGNVACYGDNRFGQAASYAGGNAKAVSAGYLYTCILTTAGNLDCYGNNDYGQANDYLFGDILAVSAGALHKCALKVGGAVGCGGLNNYGQADGYVGRTPAVGVSAGSIHSCALLSNGNIDCWGDDSEGQSDDYLGGDAVQMDAGGFTTCWLKADKTVHCQGEVGFSAVDAVQVSVGDAHVCALLASGSVECGGSNSNGQSEGHTYIDTDPHPEIPWIPGPLVPCDATGAAAVEPRLPGHVVLIVPCS